MSGNGGAHRDGRRFGVAGFAHHDDIGVLTQQRAQPRLKGKPRQRVDLRLVDARQVAFHGVLDSRNIDLPVCHRLQDHIQRRRFAAAGGTGQVDDAVGAVQQGQKALVGFVVHTKMVGVFNAGAAGQNTQHRFFAKDGGQNGHTDVDIAAGVQPRAEMPVLRDAMLGNVEVGHNFDAGDQRLVQRGLQGDVVDDDAVDAHTHLGLFFKRLDVDIRRAGGHRALYKAVQQADDGRFGVAAGGADVNGKVLGAQGCHIAGVGAAGGLAGADLGVVVADGAAQRLQFCQHDLRLHTGQLADILDGVVVQRVVGGNGQRAPALRNGQHIVFLCDFTRDFFNSGNIHRQFRKIHDAQVQTASQRFQHLTLVDKAQLLQRLPQAQLAVFPLVSQCGGDLLGIDVAKLLQNIA